MRSLNLRAHYRIVYPEADRPTFHWTRGAVTYVVAVFDCSVRGLRLDAPPDRDATRVGERVTGRLRWCDGQELVLAGTLVRQFDRQVSVRLDAPGVPPEVLNAEQHYLRERYANWRPARTFA